MIERGYQLDYAQHNEAMHSIEGRERKAATMLLVLQEAFGERLGSASLLNLGCSTGIIDEFLAPYLGATTGVDIDSMAIDLAQSRKRARNARFLAGDAMNLNFDDASFDIVVCSQVYEHVPDPVRMMAEIRRVLRPGGCCFFAATNRWAVMEKHYHLPFLSWLPRRLSTAYLRLSGRGESYYERHLGYGSLLDLVHGFELEDFTGKIIDRPEAYGAAYMFGGRIRRGIVKAAYAFFRPMFPGFIWLLWRRAY